MNGFSLKRISWPYRVEDIDILIERVTTRRYCIVPGHQDGVIEGGQVRKSQSGILRHLEGCSLSSGCVKETWCDEEELRSSEERDKGTDLVIKERAGCESTSAKEKTVYYLDRHGMCSAGSEATDPNHLSCHTDQVEGSGQCCRK